MNGQDFMHLVEEIDLDLSSAKARWKNVMLLAIHATELRERLREIVNNQAVPTHLDRAIREAVRSLE